MLSEMGQYLEEAEKSRKGQMKKKLLDWGGALDLCARKEEQLRKAERLRKEHRKIWEESDSMDGRRILAEIDRKYEMELERIRDGIEQTLRRKAEMDRRIEELDGEEQKYLLMRYGKGYSIDYVCMKLHMSRASLFRLQDKILQELEKVESI